MTSIIKGGFKIIRFRLINKKIPQWKMRIVWCHSAAISAMDAFTTEVVKKQKNRSIINNPLKDIMCIRNFVDTNKPKEITHMTNEELSIFILELLSKNKDKEIDKTVAECCNIRKFISEAVIKKLFQHYSASGRPEMVASLQKYCVKVDPYLYRRNSEFLHYMAKAQCLKGNSEKGLATLQNAYSKYEKSRSYYRLIFRELIHDSVLNRSEASLVIFKKYVLRFSEIWHDHYPVVCLWHFCWSSSWFSDQMFSNELLEVSQHLQDIVRDKATAFSISILKSEYNEDAVMRLLQILLKYKMMDEYGKVLQILFSYKLRNGDLRGCAEIIRNCEVLGIKLPAEQQGRYIKMLIDGKTAIKPGPQFKLKF